MSRIFIRSVRRDIQRANLGAKHGVWQLISPIIGPTRPSLVARFESLPRSSRAPRPDLALSWLGAPPFDLLAWPISSTAGSRREAME
jgi:hypothetical protein